MSAKENRRTVVLSALKAGRLKLVQASGAMGVSHRQAKRIWGRFQQPGAAGIVHRSRGRPGSRQLATSLRARLPERYRRRYPDFGPTLAAEHLAWEGLRVDHETPRALPEGSRGADGPKVAAEAPAMAGTLGTWGQITPTSGSFLTGFYIVNVTHDALNRLGGGVDVGNSSWGRKGFKGRLPRIDRGWSAGRRRSGDRG